MVFFGSLRQRKIRGKKREKGCLCCRQPHEGRPVIGGGSMPLGFEEENELLRNQNFECDGGLMDLIQQLELSNLLAPAARSSSSSNNPTRKLKPALARQVAAAAKSRAQSTARNQSPGERQANCPHVAPLEIEEIVKGKLLGVGGFSYVYEINAFDLSASTAVAAGSPGALKRLSISSSSSSSSFRPLCYSKEQRRSRQFLSQYAVRSRKDERGATKNLLLEEVNHLHQPGWGSREFTYRGSESSVDPFTGTDSTDEVSSKIPQEGSIELLRGGRDDENAKQQEVIAVSSCPDDDDDENSRVDRYTMKHLKPSLMSTPEKFVRAAMDLACEAEMLLCLDHPNIIKLRGWAAHGPSSYKSGDYNAQFLVLDRLVETLQDRVYSWRRRWKRLHRRGISIRGSQKPLSLRAATRTGGKQRIKEFLQKCLPSGTRKKAQMLSQQHKHLSKDSLGSSQEQENDDTINVNASFPGSTKAGPQHDDYQQCMLQQQLDALLVERLHVGQDIVCALEYLHDKRIIYRDLKTTNVGFDIRGNVKLFDFGLSRYLQPPATPGDVHEVYPLSTVGTRRYIAPEVTAKKMYNQKADVYSCGVVLWEIMSMSSPRAHRVCPVTGILAEAQKLNSCPCWPVELQNLVSDMLNLEHQSRPTIKSVRISLENVIRRTLSETNPAAGGSSSLEMLHRLGNHDSNLGLSPRQRRRSTFRLDSFNMEDLIDCTKTFQTGLDDPETDLSLAQEDGSLFGSISAFTNASAMSSQSSGTRSRTSTPLVVMQEELLVVVET